MFQRKRRVTFISHEGAILEWDIEYDGEWPHTFTLNRDDLEAMIREGIAKCNDGVEFMCYRGKATLSEFDQEMTVRRADGTYGPVYLERIA